MSCCVCGADDFAEGWQLWDDHPAQRHWEVLKDLGSGALSQVVLARHRVTGELAALKVVFLESPAVADDPEHLAILQRESDLLGMLEHPNIVECKDVIRSPRQLVLVLEWLRGGQVIDRLHELGLQYSEQQAAQVFVQVAHAVAHLHEYGILHRDIKPENVMFAEPPAAAAAAPPVITAADLQGRAAGHKAAPGAAGGKGGKGAAIMPTVKLLDLGMACLYDPTKPQRGALGSPGFVAPEIVADGVHTPAMDVFSLGVLLFIMLVGRKPFNIRESENLRYALMSLQEAPGLKDPRWLDLSPDAKHLLMGMLAYDPARRLTIHQVLAHEWVVSRGGILPRPLGADVVLGARTVASIRRLRNLCGGVVTFNRAAAAATSGAASKRGGRTGQQAPADSAKDTYLRRLRQSQRLEQSSRGGSVMKRVASSLAGSAYAKAHDAGGSVHPADDTSRRRAGGATAGGSGWATEGSRSGRLMGALPWLRASKGSLQGGSLHGPPADPSASRRQRFAALLPGGLTRAGTAVFLNEVDPSSWSPGQSQRGSGSRSAAAGSRHGLRGRSLASLHAVSESGLQATGNAVATAGGAAGQAAMLPERRPSALQLLSSAAKVYLEGSSHGRRSQRGGKAAAALLAGTSSHGAGAMRQVADDSQRGLAQRQQAAAAAGLPAGAAAAAPHLLPLAALPDGSTSSCSSASSRGLAAAAAAGSSARGGSHHLTVPERELSEGRQRGTMIAALAAGVPHEHINAMLAMRTAGSGSLPSSVGSPSLLAPPGASSHDTAAGTPALSGTPPRPTSIAAALAAAAPGTPARTAATAPIAVPGAQGAGGSRSGAALDGLRPHRVVQRRSLENPMAPAAAAAAAASPAPGRTWAEMQATQLRTPRSGRNSREGTVGSTPSTRVVRIKPLE
ncbi:CAMK CAMK1 kinase Srk1 isoform B [Chlorella sorokiniana]|uniref:CAMK CAMK1 kinase Srk1 isoform B n=1 Tax=Chlorella sorokiniana TaxID=3076 RepID=A0A2P6TKU1_CHLSO|nr:CAMK CAMK1 kinase Srk1 isoform B [Chlorella sorokiniana]|eukprot:PRW44918.1 CAMK CAMK1 kinase Srk1 isoform B [Chlorella sorokiniana]